MESWLYLAEEWIPWRQCIALENRVISEYQQDAARYDALGIESAQQVADVVGSKTSE